MRAVRGWLLLIVLLGSFVLSGQWPGTDVRAEPDAGGLEAPGPAAPSEHALRCEAGLAPRGQHAQPRIGTWNVRWFPLGSAKGKDRALFTDVRWLACEIAALHVDVLALQEVLDTPAARNAQQDLLAQLDALTGGGWRLELDACPSGNQHVAFLWDARRVELRDIGAEPSLNPHGKACAKSLRPGLRASARWPNGEQHALIALHLDSGEKPRDFENRSASVAALAGLLEPRASAIVLGDYNSMGCEECAPQVSAAEELATLDAQLTAHGLARVEPREGRACSHYYKRRAVLLDHIAVSRALAPRARLETHGACARLACERPDRGARVPEWKTLSDHCPVVLELE